MAAAVSDAWRQVESALDFAAHATLLLHHRTSADGFLDGTAIREVVTEAGASTPILEFIGRLRAEGVSEFRLVVLRPGDLQGLKTTAVLGVPQAVVISNQSHLLIPEPGAVLHQFSHDGAEPALTVRQSLRQLDLAVNEIHDLLDHGRPLIPTMTPRLTEPHLELPEGFTADARRLVGKASLALTIVTRARTQTIDRDRAADQIRTRLLHLESIAVRALSAATVKAAVDGPSH